LNQDLILQFDEAKKPIDLRKAINKNQLSKFIEQNPNKVGDLNVFDSTLDSMLKKKKSTRQTSSEDSSEN